MQDRFRFRGTLSQDSNLTEMLLEVEAPNLIHMKVDAVEFISMSEGIFINDGTQWVKLTDVPEKMRDFLDRQN